MPATVKRVSKARSNNKLRRPKKMSPQTVQRDVPETVDIMTAEASAPALAEGVNAAVPAAAANSQGRIVLGATCTIHEAPALRAHLLEQTAHPGPYEIDGAAVQQIDTAGVQLVVAFALDCLEKGIHYVWTGRSPVLDEAIRTLGVGALLESPGAATNYSAPGAA
jgi:phospholipid transport system transporter-binding protein